MGPKRLIPQAGGEPPKIETVRTEIRSNEAFPPQPPPDPDPKPSPAPLLDACYLGYMIIEWRYRVALHAVIEFNEWLAANESKLLKIGDKLDGIRYRGTYVEVLNSDGVYRTFWAYEHPDRHKNWANLIAGDEVLECVKELRKWWLKDPDRSERRYQPAHLFVGKALGPFFKLTLDAARELAGVP